MHPATGGAKIEECLQVGLSQRASALGQAGAVPRGGQALPNQSPAFDAPTRLDRRLDDLYFLLAARASSASCNACRMRASRQLPESGMLRLRPTMRLLRNASNAV